MLKKLPWKVRVTLLCNVPLSMYGVVRLTFLKHWVQQPQMSRYYCPCDLIEFKQEEFVVENYVYFKRAASFDVT